MESRLGQNHRYQPDGLVVLLATGGIKVVPRYKHGMSFSIVVPVGSVPPPVSLSLDHPPLVFPLRENFNLVVLRVGHTERKRIVSDSAGNDSTADHVEFSADVAGLFVVGVAKILREIFPGDERAVFFRSFAGFHPPPAVVSVYSFGELFDLGIL
ncbi:hypothetical protein ThrDRAFT_02032 [Frankia casuarinae]|nr:hypothetical protein ThrDRAFT_02032 [Frankia casuarinae]